MPLQLDALIKKTKAAIAAEEDPTRLAALTADLAAYVKAAKDCDDEEDEDEDEEEEKASGARKGGEADEEEEEEEESKKAKKKASIDTSQLAAILGVSAEGLPGALAAVVEKAEKFDALAGDVEQLKATQKKAAKNALIDEAQAQRRITKHQAKELRGKPMSFVESYLSMHKAALVNIDDEALHVPDGTPDADVPANVKKLVDQAVTAMGLSGEAADRFRAKAIEDHRKAMAHNTGVTH